jgi:phytanoyl-CoA hydroxylase
MIANMAITETKPSSGTATMTLEPPVVGSNEGKIPRQYIRWLSPTPRDTPVPEMRARLERDGYLFVKGLLPRQDVLDVRRE